MARRSRIETGVSDEVMDAWRKSGRVLAQTGETIVVNLSNKSVTEVWKRHRALNHAKQHESKSLKKDTLRLKLAVKRLTLGTATEEDKALVAQSYTITVE